MKKNLNTKTIVNSGVLIALSIIMPYFMPTITLSFTTFTLFSHVPVIIAMFISPITGLLACVGTTLAFFLKSPLHVALRAATHIIFVMVGSIMIKLGKGRKTWYYIIFLGIMLGLIHAVSEVFAIFFYRLAMEMELSAYYIIVEVGLITLMHHAIDYTASLIVYQACAKARLVEDKFNYFSKKKTLINQNKSANNIDIEKQN